jgi:hypothetical protein
MNRFRKMRCGLVLVAAAGIAACGGGGDAGGASGTGTVSLSLMDRPVDDISELWVTITGVSLKPAGGPPREVEMTQEEFHVNLLELDDRNATLLVNAAVIPAGRYNWIELRIDDSNIDTSYAMTLAGGKESVDVDVPSDKIRLVSGFDVGDNQAVRLLFDWDVRAGLTEAVGSRTLKLRPAFRILDVDEYGVISGTVAAETIQNEPTCAGKAGSEAGKVVYVFEDVEGVVTMPDDIDDVPPDPVTTADVVLNVETGLYEYRAAVMPGVYTVAFTCQGDMDEDDTNDVLKFLPEPAAPSVTLDSVTQNVEVSF